MMKTQFLILFFIFANLAPLCEAQEISLTATPLKEHVIQGEPVFLKVELRNTSAKSLVLPCGLYESSLALRIQVLKDGKQVRHYGRAVDLPSVSRSKIELSSKTTLHLQINLPFSWDISRPGQYEVKIAYVGEWEHYRNNRGAPLADADKIWAGEIKAPDVVFQVKEPSGLNKEAYDFLFQKHKAKWEKHAIERKTRMYSDDEIRAEIGRDFWLNDTLDLLENFSASLYTAYALHIKYGVMRDRVKFDPRAKHLASHLELIPTHHPDFVFLDEVYEMLGEYNQVEGDTVKALYYYGLAAKAAKTPELKARAQEFIEALQNPEKQKITAR